MPSSSDIFPTPQSGASLIIAWRCAQRHVLVIGNNHIAANRAFSALEADAKVTVVAPRPGMCDELEVRIERGEVQWVDDTFRDDHLDGVDLAFVCLRDPQTCADIARSCRARRVPVNVTDANELCDFYMTSMHRDGPVQIAVSTNGQASKIASRLRRHVAAALPVNVGEAVRRVGVLRKKIRAADPAEEASARRMRWLAQICEYWSIEQLARMSDDQMEELLRVYGDDEGYESMEPAAVTSSDVIEPQSQADNHTISLTSPRDITAAAAIAAQPTYTPHISPLYPPSVPTKGRILLVGSGPGDPSLLTMRAHRAITEEADLVLADKLIPAEVLSLVRCDLKIARKFPGNADRAQDELNSEGLAALAQGKVVVRLKQGDPFLFGRGGEELLFYRSHGYNVTIVPGLSSAMAAPLLAGIPLTHRTVASQLLITTGTGRANSAAPLPTHDSTRTDVFLMAVHRLADLTRDLVEKQGYPSSLPCAIVERASCPDQRVVWGTLGDIVKVLEACGGSRPPGLLVVGEAVRALWGARGEKGFGRSLAEGVEVEVGGAIVKGGDESNLLGLHDPEGVC
ncbi:hypothetical protein BC938DRAFT_477199 [Jimgerdemannia flammicorona]|uniref:Uncharacterized protein n=1 Tax=Jimgerdemannia flammicorona TaxID=994334 RepID=A0A433QPN0_9FUNG|nr:hypothetical protein BC938DRAFT_477199 [Jimgerdemannia flammicorona]